MGKPWMTEPKAGEAITEDWRLWSASRQAYSLGPDSTLRGSALRPENVSRWRRPDPDYEFADIGDIFTAEWKWLENGCITGRTCSYVVGRKLLDVANQVSTGWLKPRKKGWRDSVKEWESMRAPDEHTKMLEFFLKREHIDEEARKRAWAAWEVD